jgi:hypothetical protein
VAPITSRSSVVDAVAFNKSPSLIKGSMNSCTSYPVGYSLANLFPHWHRPLANPRPCTSLPNNHAAFSHGEVGADYRFASSTAWGDARFRPSSINCLPSCDYNCHMSIGLHNCYPFAIVYQVLHCPYSWR